MVGIGPMAPIPTDVPIGLSTSKRSDSSLEDVPGEDVRSSRAGSVAFSNSEPVTMDGASGSMMDSNGD